LLGGRRIVTHHFEVSTVPEGGERVLSRAQFDVKLLGITVYRYRHEAREHWQDGCLSSLEAETRDNGKELAVRAAQRDGVFRVEAAGAATPALQCAVAYAYWDSARLLRQELLLNPQTGRFDAVRFEERGTQPLQTAGGMVQARQVKLHNAEGAIDLWYAPDGQWLQLA